MVVRALLIGALSTFLFFKMDGSAAGAASSSKATLENLFAGRGAVVAGSEDHQSKQLMFGVFSGCNIGTELVSLTKITDLVADTTSYSRNDRAKACYCFVRKNLKESLYDGYKAYTTAHEKEEATLNFDSLFDLKKKETAATAMEIEFDNAAGPAVAIANKTTDDKIKALEKEIKKLQQQHKKSKNSTGAEKTANAKKSAEEKSSQKQWKRKQKGKGKGRGSSRENSTNRSQRS